MGEFRFKQFSVTQDRSALRLGTDAVLLGAALTLPLPAREVLDVGTGCGVIALMLAQRFAARESVEALTRITGIDIDAPSILDAEANFASSPWSPFLRAQLVPLAQYRPEGPLDLIVSNPPFFDNSLQNPDPRESAARHSITLSYRDIIAFASQHLRDGGQLSFILPAPARQDAVRLGASCGLKAFRQLLIKGNARKPVSRVILEMRRGAVPATLLQEEMVLMDGNARSRQYSALTQDFYL